MITLTGQALSLGEAERIVFGNAIVRVSDQAQAAMSRARALVNRYIDEGIPAYGLNTGLGARAGETLPREELSTFSTHMVRGRAQGVGPCLAAPTVRAVILARLNTLLSGAAGASPAVAGHLETALNRNLLPAMPSHASIGAGDLVAMATLAHAFIGEGEFLDANGNRQPAAQALNKAGLEPLVLGPKDGLVLCNNAAFSTGIAVHAAILTRRTIDALHLAAALSLQGFRASPTPFDAGVTALRPQPGQQEAARRIEHLLKDSAHWQSGKGRRLQDPLSLRCIAQVHGAVLAQFGILTQAVETELNGVSDNPVILAGQDRIVSTGNFHTPWASQCLDAMARSLAWAATDSVSRIHRLMSAQVSGLPPLLSSSDTGRAGFGPLLKPVEALRARIVHLATPVPVLPSFNADGIEDSLTHAALAGQKLIDLNAAMHLLLGYELAAAAQAVDLAAGEPPAGAWGEIHNAVRERCAFIAEDRPVGRDIEAIAQWIADGGASGISQT